MLRLVFLEKKVYLTSLFSYSRLLFLMSAAVLEQARPTINERLSVRDRIKVIFVNTQPRKAIADYGLPPYENWIKDHTGLAHDQLETIDLAEGDKLPDRIEASGVMGGGSGIDFGEGMMPDAPILYRNLHTATDRPFFGICYSLHAAAHGLGGTVERGAKGRRFGIERASLTTAGRDHPMFNGVPDEFDIFTSHKDVVTSLPQTANGHPVVELARGAAYPFLAVGAGETWLIQDHFEVNPFVMEKLTRVRTEELREEGILGETPDHVEAFVADLHTRYEEIRLTNQQIGHNWVRSLL